MSTLSTTPNGTCDRLGDVELAYIMNLLVRESGSIPEKLALGHVSQRWRAVSTSTPTIWSKFTVRTRGDVLSVPTVMERVRGAPLQVSLDFGLRREPKDAATAPTIPVIDYDTRAVVYAYLSPQVHRIRSLSIDFGPPTSAVGPSEPLEELFSFAISQMNDLSIHWRTERWVRERRTARVIQAQPIVIPLELPTEITPRLRSLSLTNVVPTDWSAVITPTLENLYLAITRVDDPFLLLRILRTCPRLTNLTFLPLFVEDPTDEAIAALDCPPSVCKRLRSIHLGSPFESLWKMVSTVLDPGHIDSITIALRDENPLPEVINVAHTILPGLGPLVACSLLPVDPDGLESRFRVEDAAGRSREMIMPAVYEEHGSFAQLWADLAPHLGTIQHMTFWQWHWLILVDAFRNERPSHPNLELRLVLASRAMRGQDDARFVSMLGRPDYHFAETLGCPTLAKLTFDVGDALPETKLSAVLACLDMIAERNPGQSTQVCVANCSQRHMWVTPMRDALAERAGWVLCEHGCSHL